MALNYLQLGHGHGLTTTTSMARILVSVFNSSTIMTKTTTTATRLFSSYLYHEDPYYKALSSKMKKAIQEKTRLATLANNNTPSDNNNIRAVQNNHVHDHLPNAHTPWLMLQPGTDKATGEMLDRFYSPAENAFVELERKKMSSGLLSDTARCVGSTLGGWLGFKETNCKAKDYCSVYLFNPYYKKLFPLPSLEYQLIDPQLVARTAIRTLALSGHPGVKNCVALAIQGNPSCLLRTIISNNNNNDDDDDDFLYTSSNYYERWNVEDFRRGDLISSRQTIVYSPSRLVFYTIMFDGTEIEAYDLQSKKLFDFPIQSGGLINNYCSTCRMEARYYLAVLNNGDDLLLLVRHIDKGSHSRIKTLSFDVYVVDFRFKRLERVHTLEEHSIFVGSNQPFSLQAHLYPGLKPNHIYFTDDTDHQYAGDNDWNRDHGMFNVEDKQISPLDLPDDLDYYTKQDMRFFWVAPVHLA